MQEMKELKELTPMPNDSILNSQEGGWKEHTALLLQHPVFFLSFFFI